MSDNLDVRQVQPASFDEMNARKAYTASNPADYNSDVNRSARRQRNTRDIAAQAQAVNSSQPKLTPIGDSTVGASPYTSKSPMQAAGARVARGQASSTGTFQTQYGSVEVHNPTAPKPAPAAAPVAPAPVAPPAAPSPAPSAAFATIPSPAAPSPVGIKPAGKRAPSPYTPALAAPAVAPSPPAAPAVHHAAPTMPAAPVAQAAPAAMPASVGAEGERDLPTEGDRLKFMGQRFIDRLGIPAATKAFQAARPQSRYRAKIAAEKSRGGWRDAGSAPVPVDNLAVGDFSTPPPAAPAPVAAPRSPYTPGTPADGKSAKSRSLELQLSRTNSPKEKKRLQSMILALRTRERTQ